MASTLEVNINILDKKGSIKLLEYIKCTESAEKNLAEGRFLHAALDNMSAARHAKQLDLTSRMENHAKLAYKLYMASGNQTVTESGKSVCDRYSCFEVAALIAEEFGMGREKVFDAAKAAIATIAKQIESAIKIDANKVQVGDYAYYNVLNVSNSPYHYLQEGERIMKKFGMEGERKILDDAFKKNQENFVNSLMAFLRKPGGKSNKAA